MPPRTVIFEASEVMESGTIVKKGNWSLLYVGMIGISVQLASTFVPVPARWFSSYIIIGSAVGGISRILLFCGCAHAYSQMRRLSGYRRALIVAAWISFLLFVSRPLLDIFFILWARMGFQQFAGLSGVAVQALKSVQTLGGIAISLIACATIWRWHSAIRVGRGLRTWSLLAACIIALAVFERGLEWWSWYDSDRIHRAVLSGVRVASDPWFKIRIWAYHGVTAGYVAVIACALWRLAIFGHMIDILMNKDICPECGYDLSAKKITTCPECGRSTG